MEPGSIRMVQTRTSTELHQDIVRSEGPIYFAGEHCSLQHSWMQGALTLLTGCSRYSKSFLNLKNSTQIQHQLVTVNNLNFNFVIVVKVADIYALIV